METRSQNSLTNLCQYRLCVLLYIPISRYCPFPIYFRNFGTEKNTKWHTVKYEYFCNWLSELITILMWYFWSFQQKICTLSNISPIHYLIFNIFCIHKAIKIKLIKIPIPLLTTAFNLYIYIIKRSINSEILKPNLKFEKKL